MARSRKTQPRIWERTFLLNEPLNRELRQCIDDYFPKGGTPEILDVGCGSMPYRELFDGRCERYVGCDAYPMADGVVKCPADDLSFEDGTFDAVVTFQVLEHVPKPWRVIEECSRVCKPGGIVLVTVPFMFPHHASPTDFYRYTHEGLEALADHAGLNVELLSSQCGSFGTLLLMTNWYSGIVKEKLAKHRVTRPTAFAVDLSTTALNALGWGISRLGLDLDHNFGNAGPSNFLLVARKPS